MIRDHASWSRRWFIAIAILSLLGVQPAQAQYIKDNFPGVQPYIFFRSNDNLAFKMLQKLYAPNEEIIKTNVKRVFGWDIGIDIQDWFLDVTVACDNEIIKARIHLGDDYFDHMELLQPVTWETPLIKKNAMKAFTNEMTKKYDADAIAWIEKKIGKRISAMNEIELYLSALTLHYYTYDEDAALYH